MTERLERLHQMLRDTRVEVGRVILGQEQVIDSALIVILVRQHALLEGVPGVAKTLLARTLARLLVHRVADDAARHAVEYPQAVPVQGPPGHAPRLHDDDGGFHCGRCAVGAGRRNGGRAGRRDASRGIDG